MLITGANNVKLVKKSLLVLIASIEASLRYIIEPDLASGYALLKQNADQVLCKLNPNFPLNLTCSVEQRVVIITLDRIIKEYDNMRKNPNALIEVHNQTLSAYLQEIDEEPESRKKTPAYLDTLSRGLKPSGIGT
jgi:ABC-type transporter MlaC component